MGVGVDGDSSAGDGGAGKAKAIRKGAQYFMLPGGKWTGHADDCSCLQVGDFPPTVSVAVQRGGQIVDREKLDIAQLRM